MVRNPIKCYRPSIPYDPDRDWFLCSYPRSGRTWVRYFLVQYYNIVFDLKLSVRPSLTGALQTLVPSEWLLRDRALKGMDCALYSERFRMLPRVIASHKEFSKKLYGKTRLILLTRCIEDTLVSYYHFSIAGKLFEGTLSEFIHTKAEEWVSYNLEWYFGQQFATSLCRVRYEDLHENPVFEFTRLTAFLDLPIKPAWIRAAIALSSFEYMKVSDTSPKHRQLARQGKVFGSHAVLSTDDLEYLDTWSSKALL